MPDELQLPGIDPIQRQRLYQERPWELLPFLLRPCQVKILMVTDRGGSFGSDSFGLSALLSALSVPPGPWARFDITTANRQSDPTASLQNFRFDRHDLRAYSQIWMFGVQRTGDQDLGEAELRAIAQFMDAGGGVFATGDHEDLGAAMCRRIPRVRSMRKWHWPAQGPNGEPVAPNATGVDRHDTRRPGHDTVIDFDDQSDDVPQRITPRLYPSWRPPWSPLLWPSYPHPLLCGPRGVIRVLPDHMHEGECYETQDLSSSLTFDGYTTTEYPSGIAPQVIAWAHVNARTQGEPVHGRSFGVIGAYDGHRADVGRVAVDATWHHFFNINLIGVLGHPDPIKAQGFTATAAGRAALADITAYYRNLGVWLAAPDTQQCMWWRSLWWARWHDRIVMNLRPRFLTPRVAAPVGELVRIGAQARDVLGSVASRCTVWRWVGWYLLRRRYPDLWIRLERYLDPWTPSPRPEPGLEGEVAVPAHAELLLDAVLGGAVHAVARAFPDHSEESRNRAEEIDFAELVGADVDRCLEAVIAQVGDEGRRLGEFGEILRHRG
ncbi:hypothetical protein [Sphaerisporangium perillae]|uniref:hypothetical protein n=1 Tax=Sphaerisporangium perillae TaxID=2935860 RepID=UPI00200BF7D3|nr:hypothetical protein [Sphaerisporangium perillae]